MKVKKLLSLILAGVMMLGLLAACTGGQTQQSQAPAQSQAAEPAESKAAEPAQSQAAEPAPAGEK